MLIHGMCAMLLPLLLAQAALAQSSQSAFHTVAFGRILSIDLPKTWDYLDQNVADHLNASSEAKSSLTGIAVLQGENKILVAANARDFTGKTLATLRVSVREAESATQAELKAAQHSSPKELQSELEGNARQVVQATLKLSEFKSNRLISTKLVSNGSLLCTWSQYEQDLGKGLVISDGWICPVGRRTIKLTTMYPKAMRSVYDPTVQRLWKTLREVE